MRSALVYVLLYPVALGFGGPPGSTDKARLQSLPHDKAVGELELARPERVI